MGKLISFHDNPVTSLKKELIETEEKLKIAQHELSFFKSIYSTTHSIGDLIKLQLADLSQNVMTHQGHLKMVQENINAIRVKLENLEEMKNRVKMIDE